MPPSKNFKIEELSWDEVKQDVKKVNPELFEIVDALPPLKQHTLIRIRYPFGNMIIEDGIFKLPGIKNDLANKLHYGALPLGLLLNKGSEVFVKVPGKFIPLNVLYPGSLFGLFEVSDLLCNMTSLQDWNVCAGARSVFLLPKISDSNHYRHLKKKFGSIPLVPPTSLDDHWQLFQKIAVHPDHIDSWHSDVLFFTKEWFDKEKYEKKFFGFYAYIFRLTYLQTKYTRDEISNYLWQTFSTALYQRKIKPKSHLVDTIKHLIAIITDVLPGFSVSQQDELFFPTQAIQNAMINVYDLKKYLPTIMIPKKISSENHSMNPIYYSLSFQSLFSATPQNENFVTNLDKIREIKFMIETIDQSINNARDPDAHFQNSIRNFIQNVRFDYFHTGYDPYGEIKNSSLIPLEDINILCDNKTYKNREFCYQSAFFNGCIKISYKNTPEDSFQ